MKLISLNIWGGAIFDDLMAFVRAEASDTDIFCFQEVYSFSQPVVSRGTRMNVFQEIEEILPEFAGFFEPIQSNIDEDGVVDIPATFGQAIFVRKTHVIEERGFMFAYRGLNTMQGDDFTTMGSGFQYMRVRESGRPVTIVSVHGISRPGDKLDTPERLTQSAKIQKFLRGARGSKIACGDFNLAPETQGVKTLEEGMRNLIREFNIPTTRSVLNAKKYDGKPLQRFADYVFVSPDITVQSFKVPNISVSDHLPMILACETGA